MWVESRSCGACCAFMWCILCCAAGPDGVHKMTYMLKMNNMHKMSYSDIVFLVNPHAGVDAPARLVDALSKRSPPIDFFMCGSKEAVPAFFAASAKTHRVVVVAGGDGTVNSILPYAIDTEQVFAVYPNGSGDGFAKELGFGKNLEALLKAIQRGHTSGVDVMRAGEHYAANVVGVGFDSYVAREFAKRESRGFKAYVLESAKAYSTFEAIEATITHDDQVISGQFTMITVANTPQFGNNARIAPRADMSDGWLDLVLVRPMPVLNALLFLVEVFAGREDGTKYVSYHRARRITIETTCEHCQIDGETYPFVDKRLEIEIAGQAKWIVM